MQARATHRLAFDEHHRATQLRRADRRGIAAGTTAEHHDIGVDRIFHQFSTFRC
jgi:hypothetical protein